MECVCTVKDGAPNRPNISFRESDVLWAGGGFSGGGTGFSHFGITMKKNETKMHAVNRLLSKNIKDINKQISALEKKKYAYIALLESWAEKQTEQ